MWDSFHAPFQVLFALLPIPATAAGTSFPAVSRQSLANWPLFQDLPDTEAWDASGSSALTHSSEELGELGPGEQLTNQGEWGPTDRCSLFHCWDG